MSDSRLPIASISLVVALCAGAACGDDGGGDTGGQTTDPCGFAPCDTGVTAESSSTGGSASTSDTGTTTTNGTADTGEPIAPCSTHQDEASCVAGNPGDGQRCGWVSTHPATTQGDPPNLACTYGVPAAVCVQQLGQGGGTPFGSCGGDGTPPVYWRELGDGTVELLESDGFFTPEGWATCDCHDGNLEPSDPAACCCPCSANWPP